MLLFIRIFGWLLELEGVTITIGFRAHLSDSILVFSLTSLVYLLCLPGLNYLMRAPYLLLLINPSCTAPSLYAMLPGLAGQALASLGGKALAGLAKVAGASPAEAPATFAKHTRHKGVRLGKVKRVVGYLSLVSTQTY